MDYHKLEPILRYYLSEGFSHSMQEVADAVKITKKTLFNRYISKENMELCLIEYWQIQSCERMAQRIEYANNAVEELIMFLFELQYCRNTEVLFFQKTKEIFLGNYEQNNPYIAQLEDIFKTGIEEGLFRFDGDPKVFAYFFQFNTLFILLKDHIVNTDYISFLFKPILTDFGNTVFKDIDIEQVFTL